MRTLITPEDWADPSLVDTLAKLHQPRSLHHRKYWEYGVIARLLEERGMLDGTKVGLGLGTGQEVLCFHFARHAKQVIATDLFSSTTDWECARLELEDVYKKSPFAYPRERLEFRNMDMRAIDLPAESVDFIWSTSSVEHVDTVDDYLQVFREISRVLKPGGVAVIVTEFNLRASGDYLKNLILVDVPLLRRVEETSGLTIGPLDLTLDDHPDNVPFPLHHLDAFPFWGHLPNIWAHYHGVLFTSARLVFEKTPQQAPFEVVQDIDRALVARYDAYGAALRKMGPLEGTPVTPPAAVEEPPAPAEPPLRHLIADRVNDLLKRSAEPMHRVGKKLSERIVKSR